MLNKYSYTTFFLLQTLLTYVASLVVTNNVEVSELTGAAAVSLFATAVFYFLEEKA